MWKKKSFQYSCKITKTAAENKFPIKSIRLCRDEFEIMLRVKFVLSGKQNIPGRWDELWTIKSRPLPTQAATKQNTARNFKWIFGQSCSPNIEIRQLDESARTALVNNNGWFTERNILIWNQRTRLITRHSCFVCVVFWVRPTKPQIYHRWMKAVSQDIFTL